MSLIINNNLNVLSNSSYTKKVSEEYKNKNLSSSCKTKQNKNHNRHLLIRQASTSELHHFLSPNEKKVLKEIFNISDVDMKRYETPFQPRTNVALLKGSKLSIKW